MVPGFLCLEQVKGQKIITDLSVLGEYPFKCNNN